MYALIALLLYCSNCFIVLWFYCFLYTNIKIKTCFIVSDSGMFPASLWHGSGMYWAWFQNVLGLFRVCFRNLGAGEIEVGSILASGRPADHQQNADRLGALPEGPPFPKTIPLSPDI